MTITQVKTARFYGFSLTCVEFLLHLAQSLSISKEAIAEGMGVHPESVTSIAKLLSNRGLITAGGKTYLLTQKGRDIARQLTQP